jgi:hypothetical protein
LRIRIFFTIGIRDKFFPDTGSFWPWFQLRLRICSRKHTGKKKTVSLHSTFHIGSGRRKCSDPGKNYPDPQHWIWLKFSNQNHNLHTLRYRFFWIFFDVNYMPLLFPYKHTSNPYKMGTRTSSSWLAARPPSPTTSFLCQKIDL